MTASPLDEPAGIDPGPALRTGLLRIRITGQPADVKAFAGQLADVADILMMSDDKPGRTGQDLVHRFGSIMLRR
jgi:hypothetical protein